MSDRLDVVRRQTDRVPAIAVGGEIHHGTTEDRPGRLLAIHDADQLDVVVAERYDAVRGPPSRVPSPGDRGQPVVAEQPVACVVEIAHGHHDVIDNERDPERPLKRFACLGRRPLYGAVQRLEGCGGSSSIVIVMGFAWMLRPSTSLAAANDPQLVADHLSFPSNMAFAPDGRLFFAEKDTGDIRVIEDGRLLPEPFAHIDVLSAAEQGLLGLALDPAFDTDPWVYIYYSDPVAHINRLARLRTDGGSVERQPLLDALTTENGYHNGGDIVFGRDGELYLSVGEVHESQRAQDPNDLGGKVLRLNPDGTVPSDDPFGAGNPAYSMGHRNSFGLCVDPSNGDLWETENGPRAATTRST